MKAVPGLLELGKEALLRRLELEGPGVCWGIERIEVVFSSQQQEWSHWLRTSVLQLETWTQVCIPTVLEFRIPFPCCLKQTGSARVPFSSTGPHKDTISNIL